MPRNNTAAGDWLISTAKRHPEALLVLAAGAILLLRGKSGEAETDWQDADWDKESDELGSYQDGRRSDDATADTDTLRGRVSDFAGAATDYATEVGEQVFETAAEYADQGRRLVYDRASRLGSQAHDAADWVLREQPIAVAALGLAAGAAVAALLPSTNIENLALGPARERLSDVAQGAAEKVREAARDMGKELKANVADRVLSGDAARDVVKVFANSLKGGEESKSS
jgi:hypothetical protein